MKTPTTADAREFALRQLRTLRHHLTTPSDDGAPLLGDSRRRWVRRVPYVIALILQASLIPTGIVCLNHFYDMVLPVAAALTIAQTTPLFLAITRPLAAWWISAAALVTTAAITARHTQVTGSWPWTAPMVIAYVFLLLALALRESLATLISVWIATVLLTVLTTTIGLPRSGDGTTVLLIALSGAVLLLGWAVRDRALARRLLTEQEQISEVERERRTLLEERARIARELHDVVAHHMSVIAVQAASAPYRIEDVPADAAEEFTAIAGTARESLSEMRRLLGVLRSEDTAGEKAPQPGVAQLAQLVETVGRAGVPAELTVDEGLADRVPQAVSLSAYRIVQEALANVVRHAPGARTWVSLSADGPELRLTVVNAPPPQRTESLEASAEGTGQGLVGMRERVRLVDGRLDTGPLPDGGFKVAAVLPLDPPQETPA
ncbi:sensor histidine kinase [Streptomyces sp. CBMA123]|uniref:sensor histidine kinase n=1 Tax=Streptomyces sp. CBMA123 TaxID=1896313 RepID=UPI00166204FA|nr:sensor histidine kinase [Streptomyces sp. CBMA123]MBD0688669.1 two-component sensor histidine kinase [Streptomyces sp. CBMA123]